MARSFCIRTQDLRLGAEGACGLRFATTPSEKEMPTMNVGDLMTRDVRSCAASATLNDAAQVMWEGDCGCVPVVEADGTVVGMITDRDICMAAYTQGRNLMHMTVGSAASKNVVTIGQDESLRRADELMRGAQVRRLPVVDSAGHLVGLLSLSDLARHAPDLGDRVQELLVGALAAICQPRPLNAEGGQAGTELKSDLRKGLERLQALRDEVRVRLHLGSLELKDQWRKLEPHLGEVEKRAEELTEASRAAIQDAVKRLEKLRSSLSQHN
jgi:CBS domain-containing protein